MEVAECAGVDKDLLRNSSSLSQTVQKFLKRHASLSEGLLPRQKSLKVMETALTTWEVRGVSRSLIDDFAHLCFEMHWSRLLPFIVAVYAAFSLIFASILHLTDCGSSIGGDIPPDMHPFEVCWWFSTVNLVTAGFGAMVPLGRHAYAVSTAAHLVGLLLNSLLLGIVVAKASLPTAKMVFSNVVCVKTRNGIQHLMVRVGNARGNILFSPDIRLAYIRAVSTTEGEVYFEDTQLQVKVPGVLTPVFMITHAVTPDSPLNGKTQADILKERGFFVLVVSAAEVETGQALYARRMYFMKDFQFNHQFVDVVVDFSSRVRDAERGSAQAMEQSMRETKIIDFLKFHDSVPLPPASQARSLQRGDPLFAAPQTLRASASLSSPPPEEVESPSASREQAKQLLNGQQRPTPEAKAIGVRPPSENSITPSDMPPTLLGGAKKDSAAPRPIGQYTPSGSRSSTATRSVPPAITRPSFDQAHATFERFLQTPFQSSDLPGVSEHHASDPQIERTMSMERTQSSPGAHLGDYKPIYHEEAPPIQRSMSVAQGLQAMEKEFGIERRKDLRQRMQGKEPSFDFWGVRRSSE